MTPVPGALIGGRYLLERPLGSGGFGTVFAAFDQLNKQAVAVKVLPVEQGQDHFRVRREVAALRLLSLPGVLRLLDEGTEATLHYLVTEIVDGTPFPGHGRTDYPAVLAVFQRLVESVARMHSAGVLHRDLKPSNVLVRPDGEPVILDFGLARFLDGHVTATAPGSLLGTPQYIAPEVVSGHKATVASDLYSLGVMLFEALAGRPPFGGDLRSTMLGRVLRPAPRLAEVRPGLSENVSELVDRMLAREPEYRPRSAIEVLQSLRGEWTTCSFERPFPRVGSTEGVERVVDAAISGRSMDVGGAHGAGRSRFLADVTERLGALGITVRRLMPTRRPFASLGSMLDDCGDLGGLTIEAVTERVRAAVIGVIAGGQVIVADDLEHIDRWTARVLDSVRDQGAIIRVVAPVDDADLIVEPVTAADLAVRFRGPSVLYHLPEDAASELFRRTGGLMGSVVEEIHAWVRAGLCRWDGDLIAIDRATIERLEGGLRIRVDASQAHGATPSLDRTALDLVGWVQLLGRAATADGLAQATRRAVWEVAAGASDLVAAGWLRWENDRLALTESARRLQPSWDDAEVASAHRIAAEVVQPVSIQRLYHLILAGEFRSAALAARDVADAALAEGRPGRALAALVDGTSSLRTNEAGTAEEEHELLVRWVEWASREGQLAAFDRALLEVVRARHPFEPNARLEALLRGGIAALGLDGDRALQLLDEALPAPTAECGRIRQSLRIQAARRLPIEREAELLGEAQAWARSGEATGDAEAWALGWLGLHQYRAGSFEAAGLSHEASAAAHVHPLARAAATLNAASAWMEAGDFERARSNAARSRATAAAVRNPLLEARGIWLERSAAYRGGLDLTADPELVEAARHLTAPDLRGLLLLREAVFEWRAGNNPSAADLATEAARAFEQTTPPAGAHLAQALSVACHDDSIEDPHSWWSRAAEVPVVRLRWQILALVAPRAPRGVRETWHAAFLESMGAGVDGARGRVRLDVLSLAECAERLDK